MKPQKELARSLSDYALSLSYSEVPSTVIWEAKRRILDTLGCAIAASNAEPVTIAKKVALGFQSPMSATILGTNIRTSLDTAVFANVAMARYLDFNDAWNANDVGHPSDNILACLAVSDSLHGKGRDFILSVVLAYEIQCGFFDLVNLSYKGWDTTNATLISFTLAASKLLGLTPEAATQALNISLNSHIAMRQVRKGELSMWKGCSSAEAARCAVFSTLLASEGMTGPCPIFEGENGYFNQVSGPMEVNINEFGKSGEFRIAKSIIKLFPACGAAQSAIAGALQARKKISKLTDISKIKVGTTRNAFIACVKGEEKWAPTTHETADHSIPYTVAVALIDGGISASSFDEGRLRDGSILALMKKMTVEEDPTLKGGAFMDNKCNLAIELVSGGTVREQVDYPRGYPQDPATDAELEEKFRQNTKGHMSQGQTEKVIKLVWKLDEISNVTELLEACVLPSQGR